MDIPLEEFALFGLCHSSLFSCRDDPAYHLDTLARILDRQDIEIVDIAVPYGDRYRQKALNLIKGSGKIVIYNAILLPVAKISPCTLSPTERAQLLLLAKEQVDVAYEADAVMFLQASGADPGPQFREEAFEGLGEYILDLSTYMRKKGSMVWVMELMDRELDRKALCGPTHDVVSFFNSITRKSANRGVPTRLTNVGLTIDVSHILLMQETFEHTLTTSARYLKYVHLGNCILRDRTHPWWGDQHPPFGIPGGEIDTAELIRVFKQLIDIGYLSREKRGAITLEIRPFADRSVEETISDNLRRIHEAWKAI